MYTRINYNSISCLIVIIAKTRRRVFINVAWSRKKTLSRFL